MLYILGDSTKPHKKELWSGVVHGSISGLVRTLAFLNCMNISEIGMSQFYKDVAGLYEPIENERLANLNTE